MTRMALLIVAMAQAWVWGASLPASARSSTNTPPNTPIFIEPGMEGQIVNPADVHMQTAAFSDPDVLDTHVCSDWEIATVSPPVVAWR